MMEYFPIFCTKKPRHVSQRSGRTLKILYCNKVARTNIERFFLIFLYKEGNPVIIDSLIRPFLPASGKLMEYFVAEF